MLVPRIAEVRRRVVSTLQELNHPMALDNKRDFLYVTKSSEIPAEDIITALTRAGIHRVQLLFFGTKWKLPLFLDRVYEWVDRSQHHEFDIGWTKFLPEEDAVPLFWAEPFNRNGATMDVFQTLGPLGADVRTEERMGSVRYRLRTSDDDDLEEDNVVDEPAGEDNDDNRNLGMPHQYIQNNNNNHYPAPAHVYAGFGGDAGYVYGEGDRGGVANDVMETGIPGVRKVIAYQQLTHEIKVSLHHNYSSVPAKVTSIEKAYFNIVQFFNDMVQDRNMRRRCSGYRIEVRVEDVDLNHIVPSLRAFQSRWPQQLRSKLVPMAEYLLQLRAYLVLTLERGMLVHRSIRAVANDRQKQAYCSLVNILGLHFPLQQAQINAAVGRQFGDLPLPLGYADGSAFAGIGLQEIEPLIVSELRRAMRQVQAEHMGAIANRIRVGFQAEEPPLVLPAGLGDHGNPHAPLQRAGGGGYVMVDGVLQLREAVGRDRGGARGRDPEAAVGRGRGGAVDRDRGGARGRDPEGAVGRDPEGAVGRGRGGAVGRDRGGARGRDPEGAVGHDRGGARGRDPEGAVGRDRGGARARGMRAGLAGQWGLPNIRDGDGEVAQEFLDQIGMTEEQYEGFLL